MNFRTFEDSLTKDARSATEIQPSQLANTLGRIAAPVFLRNLLRSVVQDQPCLEQVAKRSYLHPNGFTKIVLVSRPEVQLRLHLWQPGHDTGPSPPGNAHNHRWNFATALLCGGYRYQEFRPGDTGEELFSYSYHASRGAGSYVLVPTGKRRMKAVFDAFLPAGSTYTLTADVVHRVTCETGGVTASLVLQGPRTRSSNEVYSTTRLAEDTPIPLQGISPDYLAEQTTALVNGTTLRGRHAQLG